LSGLAPETRIAWDGEWLYTLSGFRLDRVRAALGTGSANERQRLRQPLRFPGHDAPTGFAWTDFRLGGDAWLHGRYRTSSPGSLLRSDGHPVRLEREGWIRFRRDGSGAMTTGEIATGPALEEIAGIDGLLLSERNGAEIGFVTSGRDGLTLGLLRMESGAAEPPPARRQLWKSPSNAPVAAASRSPT
jgi:hypothetical protein